MVSTGLLIDNSRESKKVIGGFEVGGTVMKDYLDRVIIILFEIILILKKDTTRKR